MDPNEATPDRTALCYARMKRNLELVRGRTSAPLTLADKLLYGHLDDAQAAELVPGRSYLRLRPDRVVLQDVLGQTAMLQFAQTGRARAALPTSIHCDHPIQARIDGDTDLRTSLAEDGEVYAFLRSA
ncbi:MAG TPA: aconitate hydratase, partial [Myxococcota bacterium]|nr:aconitate hydratase [Myxococcota bacterium]